MQFPELRMRIEKMRLDLLAAKFEEVHADLASDASSVPAAVRAKLEKTSEVAKLKTLGALVGDRPCTNWEKEIINVYEAHLPLADEALEQIWASFETDLAMIVGENYESWGWVGFGFRGVVPGPRPEPEPPAGGESFVNGCETLYRRLQKEGLENAAKAPPARRWWAMQTGVFLKAYRPETLEENDTRLLRLLAGFTLAQVRVELREVARGDATEAERRFGCRLNSYTLATHCLTVVDDLAFMLSQLLQLLRVSPVPLVGDDLAYWRDSRGGLLQRIPVNLVNSVHIMAARAEKYDPKLRGVREDLARFCIGRIGQKKGKKCDEGLAPTSSLVEQDPYWRACYLHAVDALRTNPDDKGHRAFYWSMHHDPEEDIRELAKELYPRVERKRDIADGSSPRRPLITAIWWMLQAHRLGMRLDVDDTAIHATLADMMRRTTETLSPAIPAGDSENPETQNAQ